MFSQVSLKNFKSYEDMTVNLKNRRGSTKSRVFLYGENGSGKTSFLLAFAFLKETIYGYRINEVYRTRKNFQNPVTIEKFNLRETAQKYYHYNACEDMVVSFEVGIKNIVYHYTMAFDRIGNIVEERLEKTSNRQTTVVFKGTAQGIEFGRNTLQKQDIKHVQYLCEKHYNHYTILSILDYVSSESPEIVLKPTLMNFIKKMVGLNIYIDHEFNQNDYINFFANSQSFATYGEADRNLLNILLLAEPMLNEIACSVFPNISKVSYRYTQLESGLYRYDLIAQMQTKTGIVEQESIKLSSSFKKMMYINVYLFDLLLGDTVVYDNFDTCLHRGPLLYMIQNMLPRLSGQFITSVNGLDSFNHIEASNIFIAHTRDFEYTIKPLDAIATIQTNHNLRRRYESGHFGKNEIPTTPSMHLLYNRYLKEILTLKKKIPNCPKRK